MLVEKKNLTKNKPRLKPIVNENGEHVITKEWLHKLCRYRDDLYYPPKLNEKIYLHLYGFNKI